MFHAQILLRPVPPLQPVRPDDLFERPDLPFLQHCAVAGLLEPANEHAADTVLDGDHACVVKDVSWLRV